MKQNIKNSLEKTLTQSVFAIPLVAGGIDGFCNSHGIKNAPMISDYIIGLYSVGGAGAGVRCALRDGEGMIKNAIGGAAIGAVTSVVLGLVGYGVGYTIGNLVKGGNK